MSKLFGWILNIIAMVAIFGAGFYIGMLDNARDRITITSECAGSGVQKSFSASFESRDGQVIKNEKTESQIYTTRCLCYAQDRAHGRVLVDSVEISDVSADAAHAKCAADCQTMCEGRLETFSF